MSVKDTIKLNKMDLRYLLLDGLKEYSDNVEFLEGNNPYGIGVNKRVIHVLIKNTHASGKNRPNQDECRIQVSYSNFNQMRQYKGLVFFLGYFFENNVFTAWNPIQQTARKLRSTKTVSFYSRFSSLERASKEGISVYKDTDSQVVISFKPEYLGLYIENFKTMHLSDEKTLLELIGISDVVDETEEIGERIEISNLIFQMTKPRVKRNPEFRRMVCKAYEHRCAFSGIQLELIEAAHIIPFSHEKGIDSVQNGICLSALHHKAYDDGLLFIDKNYNINLNDKKVEYLEKVNRDGGMQKFLKLQYEKIKLPTSKLNYPSIEFISIANKVRGIGN